MIIKDKMTVYKIRDAKTNLFSNGGISPRWSKFGKTWSSRGALKNHLNLYKSQGVCSKLIEIPESWEIVEFSVNVNETSVISAKEEGNRPSKK